MAGSYADFLKSKARVFEGDGVKASELPPILFDWQARIVRWALRKGRAAIFADCGLGKSFMQTAWAHATGERTLFFAPLCVAEQTIREAAKLGIVVHYAHDQSEAIHPLTITNYERLEKFDPDAFGAVVLDESSILKAMDGKTRTKLIEVFGRTKYRLCCTATPSPNDIAELANHSEFLGLMTRPEFLATWFVHDDEGWRMKRHAVDPFHKWLASWAVAMRSPADLGADSTGFDLPALNIHETIIESSRPVDGMLFADMAVAGIGGRLKARRASIDDRIARTLALHESKPGQWIIWCGLNDESRAIARAIGDDAVEVSGADTHAEKVGAIEAFTSGKIRTLVTKVKIAGFGMNFQHCRQMAFLGLGDSYEQYYQAIRRCWRFGQRYPVDCYVVVSEAERAIVDNVKRKEEHAGQLTAQLLKHIGAFEREELHADFQSDRHPPVVATRQRRLHRRTGAPA